MNKTRGVYLGTRYDKSIRYVDTSSRNCLRRMPPPCATVESGVSSDSLATALTRLSPFASVRVTARERKARADLAMVRALVSVSAARRAQGEPISPRRAHLPLSASASFARFRPSEGARADGWIRSLARSRAPRPLPTLVLRINTE